MKPRVTEMNHGRVVENSDGCCLHPLLPSVMLSLATKTCVSLLIDDSELHYLNLLYELNLANLTAKSVLRLDRCHYFLYELFLTSSFYHHAGS